MIVQSIDRVARFLRQFLVIFLVLGFWELLPRSGLVKAEVLPSFSAVFATLIETLRSGELLTHWAISFERITFGFTLSVVIAVPLGLLLGSFEKFDRILNPILELARNTPTLALYPLLILILGFSEFSKAGVIFLGSVWPALLNTIEGTKTVDPLLIKSTRSMGAGRMTLFFKVILPSAFPTIFTGIRLSASRAVIILVGAEMLGADSGLGYLVFHSENHFEIEKMYTGILSLICMGVAVNYLLVALEKRVTRWKQEPVEVG